MAPEQSEHATKGPRVINSVDPSVLKPNFLDYRLIIVPLHRGIARLTLMVGHTLYNTT